jgi:hypothetical protein
VAELIRPPMGRWRPAILVAAACLGSPSDASAQISADAVEAPDSTAFLAAARQAAVRYADPAIATLEGYKRIGPETPTMGAHWVHPGHVASGVFDPARPSLLSYVTTETGVVLAGVGFAMALEGDEVPPWPPQGAAWHKHAGRIEEEIREHDHVIREEPSGPHVSVFHAWVGIDNPDGVFAKENWVLPWVRLGLEPPLDAPKDAARAAALAAGFASFYRVAWGDEPGVSGQALASALARAAEDARVIVERLDGGISLDPGTVAELALVLRKAREQAFRATGP